MDTKLQSEIFRIVDGIAICMHSVGFSEAQGDTMRKEYYAMLSEKHLKELLEIMGVNYE